MHNATLRVLSLGQNLTLRKPAQLREANAVRVIYTRRVSDSLSIFPRSKFKLWIWNNCKIHLRY